MSIKIALDAGHGLKTLGKQTPDGIKEFTLNDNVCDYVTEDLSPYDCEIIRTDNNEGKTDESLAERVAKYKKEGADVVVSIHHNAFKGTWGTATGVEVYTDINPTIKDKQLAECIYKRLPKYTGLKGRGIKIEDWYVINQDKIPAVLCEGGFMDTKKDYKVITSVKGQKAYAKAVAEGLIEFCNLKKKTQPKTETKKTTTTKNTKYYKKYTGKSTSIVDALKDVGVASTFKNRRKIAKANDIKLYVGTSKQNTKMLNLLKKGKLIKP